MVTGLEGKVALQCPQLAKVTSIIGKAIFLIHAKSHYRRNRILHRCVSAFPFASHLPIFWFSTTLPLVENQTARLSYPLP